MEEMVLIRETEWSREYRIGTRRFRFESKFAREGLEVTALDILSRWHRWTPAEQLDFATAFILKPSLNSEDQLILQFLMLQGSEPVWATIAHLLPRYHDREAALSFLLQRVQAGGLHEAAYFQALERIGDRRAIPPLRRRYEELKSSLAPVEQHGLHSKLPDLQQCCRALWKLTGDAAYEEFLRQMLAHPDAAIRRRSQRFLADA